MIKSIKINNSIISYSDIGHLIADEAGALYIIAYDIKRKNYSETDSPLPPEIAEDVIKEVKQMIGDTNDQ